MTVAAGALGGRLAGPATEHAIVPALGPAIAIARIAIWPCASGLVIKATGVLEEAREQGLVVPDDLAIVGYGDVEVAQFTSPAISMVSLPAYEVGVAAMSALRRVMAGATTSPQRMVFDGSLVVRESCGRHI